MPEPASGKPFSLTVRKTLPYPRERVFAAWLDAEGMKSWMTPGSCRSAEVELDPRVGGEFRIVMRGDGGDFDHRGTYRVIEPPSKLVFTWISAGTENRESLVTVEFREIRGETEVVLTHQGLPSEDAVSRHSGGWASILEALGRRLS